jgi:hypothetical protein
MGPAQAAQYSDVTYSSNMISYASVSYYPQRGYRNDFVL